MDKFEEYRFFAESTQWLTERRQVATEIYLGVNTAIFAVIGFLYKDGTLGGWRLVILLAPLIAVGLIVSLIWFKLIMNYKEIINFRYDELMAMEGKIDGSHLMYRREFKELYSPGKKKWFGFSALEKYLPWFFILLYFLLLVVLIWGANCGILVP
jgi:hypothetical protein